MKRIASRSQYFLRSPRLIKTLIGHTSLKKDDIVYDIGAGSGVISSVLATRCARVVAFENDPRVAKKLRENTQRYENVDVIEKDFLKADLPDYSYKVFANIPFHLSSPILKKLTGSESRPTAIYLIVQKQFGEKLLIDTEKFTGLLGAQIAPFYEARIRKRLERSDFWPHPAVDTVMVELLLRDNPLITQSELPAYQAFVELCFSRQKYFEALSDKRPSQLSAAEWIELFRRHADKS